MMKHTSLTTLILGIALVIVLPLFAMGKGDYLTVKAGEC